MPGDLRTVARLRQRPDPRPGSHRMVARDALPLESLIGSLALIGESGDNDAARVGALRAQMQAMLHQSQLLVASGLMPRDLAFHVHDERGQVIEMVNRMVAVLERHDLDPRVLDDLEQAITDEAPLALVSPEGGKVG